MALFDIQPQQNNSSLGSLIKKSQPKKSHHKQTVKIGKTLLDQVRNAETLLVQHLGHHENDYYVVRDKEQLKEYLSHYNDVDGCIAIDTETTGLDPYKDKLSGICLYINYQNSKAIYVPVNHVNYIDGTRLSNQLTSEEIKECFSLVLKDAKFITHNGGNKFDVKFILFGCGFDISDNIYWDTMTAAHEINNIESHALKNLHNKYCPETDENEVIKFDDFFTGKSMLDTSKVNPDIFKLYAARDAIFTYELYKKQYQLLDTDENRDLLNLILKKEIPQLTISHKIETYGVKLDLDYAKKLSIEYNEKLLQITSDIDAYIKEHYQDKINSYVQHLKKDFDKLSDPIDINSNKQLGILLYNILGLELPKEKQNRKKKSDDGSVGKPSLEYLAQTYNQHKKFLSLILEYRGVSKLLTTYIDKLPNEIKDDGRIHATFNPIGTDTGRYSSSEPNLQNIPAKNKDIRKMFIARDGYVLIGGDFSQQEPLLVSILSDDEGMLDAFRNNRDIYATVAALAFNKPYEDCLEFYLDENGNKTDIENVEGHTRRTQAKSIVLGILYGRGIASIAEQLGITPQEAQNIYNKVISAFKKLGIFLNNSISMASTLGYVTDAWGRRRQLPDMMLPDFDFTLKKDKITGKYLPPTCLEEDPLDWTLTEDKVYTKEDIPDNIKQYYLNELKKCYGRTKREQLIKLAEQNDNIIIIDNTYKKSETTREVVNARVQGSAASLTKQAMIDMYYDDELRKLGFNLMLQIHDEVIGECPEQNARQVKERLKYLMGHSIREKSDLVLKCDIVCSKCWYGDPIEL